jgi:hypothetical protein
MGPQASKHLSKTSFADNLLRHRFWILVVIYELYVLGVTSISLKTHRLADTGGDLGQA